MMKELVFLNGDKLPSIGLGTWLSKSDEVYDAVLAAIKIGYRHIDCAYIYRNEKQIGSAIHDAIESGIVTRKELFVTSKLWNSDHAPQRVELAVRKSLSDLQLTYLDLYLIHWPVAFKTGCEYAKTASDLVSLYEMPLSKTWKAMEMIQAKGLTKHIGVSNFNIPKLKSLMNSAQIKPEVNQIELHPYFQQAELVEFCNANGILVTAYSPLGSSHMPQAEGGLAYDNIIVEIAKKHSCSSAQVLLAWGVERKTAVIPKSVKAERLLQNYEASELKLDAQDMRDISGLEKNLRIAKGLFCVLSGGVYSLKNIWEE